MTRGQGKCTLTCLNLHAACTFFTNWVEQHIYMAVTSGRSKTNKVKLAYIHTCFRGHLSQLWHQTLSVFDLTG